MKEIKLLTALSKKTQKAVNKVQKHSPEILIFAGVGGVVVSTVMACKATTKLGDILTESRVEIETIKQHFVDTQAQEKFPNDEGVKELNKKETKLITVAYIQTGVKVVKLYAPSAAIGVLSVSSIFASNNILKKRNIALAAAYTTLDTSFKEYRIRVANRFGEEVENEIRYNMKSQKIEEVEVDENGKEKKVKKTVKVAGVDGNSDYARYFDRTSKEWVQDHSYREMFLRSRQSYANDKLKANGLLYLNEAYELLGLPKSKAGQVVGWVYDPNNERGDNFVDFGIKEVYRKDETKDNDVFEKVFLVDFNVDGNIWELL
jgi:hypothetical protein